MDFSYWLNEAEKIDFKLADLVIEPRTIESTLALRTLRRLEKAARDLVTGAYIEPDEKLRDSGLSAIRVGTVAFAEMVEALRELEQMAEYYRAPLDAPDQEREEK